jgi:topoisomerase-4 subunit A
MAYVKKLFNENYLFYASYVIKDRAIPDAEDGLKPVQRRIMHSLFEMDDGKFHKVANVVGHCMKYHPHGDQSIYGALVVFANKELFIDKQGNFGNIYTGDQASAARYIECRATPLAKEIFYNPKITRYVDSYDGRNREPEYFPAKLPVILLTGTEGIAVGMSTKILPHNPVEVISAEIACLQGKPFSLMPDFPTAGLVDVGDYADGLGKVKVRARLDISDPKRILITEIPFGSTTESLIESVEAAAKGGRIKIASISDFTTEKVEIEIKLQRGVYTDEVVDALYAFTECEQSISCNCLLIQDDKPVITTVSKIVERHAATLLGILEAELKIEETELLDEIHARTLERIFIEERVYKAIETKKTQETVVRAVLDGLKPFAKEIARDVSPEDVERLLRIQIRRISLYDINKARDEMKRLSERLAEVRHHLEHLNAYAIALLTGIWKKLEKDWVRKTTIANFHKIDVKEVAKRDIALRYDSQTGYLGTAVSSGDKLFDVSSFDRLMVLRRNGIFTFVPLPERLFVDQGMLHCAIADKERIAATLMTIVYRDGSKGFPCIKRTRIEGWIMNKDYSLVPDSAQILAFSVDPAFEFTLTYKPKPRMKVDRARFIASRFDEKGLKASGLRLANREVVSVECDPPGGVPAIIAAATTAVAAAGAAVSGSGGNGTQGGAGGSGGGGAAAGPAGGHGVSPLQPNLLDLFDDVDSAGSTDAAPADTAAQPGSEDAGKAPLGRKIRGTGKSKSSPKPAPKREAAVKDKTGAKGTTEAKKAAGSVLDGGGLLAKMARKKTEDGKK